MQKNGKIFTLTRCPKANAYCFCTTLLRSWMPLSSALISLPGNNQTSRVFQPVCFEGGATAEHPWASPEYGVRSCGHWTVSVTMTLAQPPYMEIKQLKKALLWSSMERWNLHASTLVPRPTPLLRSSQSRGTSSPSTETSRCCRH